METEDLGSMTAAFDMESIVKPKKVFTITSGIDENKVFFFIKKKYVYDYL